MKLNEILDYIGTDKDANDVDSSVGAVPRTLLEYIAEGKKNSASKKPKYDKKILADTTIQAGIDAYAERGGEISPSIFKPNSNFKSGSMTNTSYGRTEANLSTITQAVRNDLGFGHSGTTPGKKFGWDGGMTGKVEQALQKHLYKLFEEITYRKKKSDMTKTPTKTSLLRTFGKFDWKALQGVVEKVLTDKNGWRGSVEARIDAGEDMAHPLSKIILKDGTAGSTVAEYLASVFVENTKSRYNGGIAGKDFNHIELWESLVDIRTGIELYNANTTDADGNVITNAMSKHETGSEVKDAEDSYNDATTINDGSTIADALGKKPDDELSAFINARLD